MILSGTVQEITRGIMNSVDWKKSGVEGAVESGQPVREETLCERRNLKISLQWERINRRTGVDE